jgi:hypothetical protein
LRPPGETVELGAEESIKKWVDSPTVSALDVEDDDERVDRLSRRRGCWGGEPDGRLDDDSRGKRDKGLCGAVWSLRCQGAAAACYKWVFPTNTQI